MHLVNQVLTVDEVAQLLCVSRPTIYKEIESGKLFAIKVGRTFRIPKERFSNYLNGTDHGKSDDNNDDNDA